MSVRDGARGWDEYAPFYDWENAQTVARRDVAFWCRLAAAQPGPILELGCGTGRIALPIARSGTRSSGSIGRSRCWSGRAGDFGAPGWPIARTSFAATSVRCRFVVARGSAA